METKHIEKTTDKKKLKLKNMETKHLRKFF